MSSQENIIEPQLTFSDLLDVRRSVSFLYDINKMVRIGIDLYRGVRNITFFSQTVSGEYLDYDPSSLTLMQKLLDEEDIDDIGSEISKTVTVILKAITHRGTQTFIQCDPYMSKEEFINMMIHMKL